MSEKSKEGSMVRTSKATGGKYIPLRARTFKDKNGAACVATTMSLNVIQSLPFLAAESEVGSVALFSNPDGSICLKPGKYEHD